MGRAILAISGSAAGFLHRPLSSFGGPIGRFWRNLARTMFDSYRPERHYMRGPGPACQAKHGPLQR
ncbi:MAG: hypothetical protein WC670_08755 [Pseudolabrys sp.]|jgi:hypothetical protein